MTPSLRRVCRSRSPRPDLPAAVHGVAISAKTPAHEDRLAMALRRIVTEDPTLSVSHDGATRQTVLSGAGETHLSVALSRIERLGRGGRIRTAAGGVPRGTRRAGRGRGQVQEADRRARSVRRRHRSIRTAVAGSGVRVRERGHRRGHSQEPHPGGRRRRRGGDGARRRARLPGRRHARRVHRRQAPLGRLVGDELQDGGLTGAARRGPTGRHRRARTDQRAGCEGAGAVPGRRVG